VGAAGRAAGPEVRGATRRDWQAIWPFFREIMRAGETLAYDRDMGEAQARAMWLDGPPSRTSVALAAPDTVVGSAHMHRNRGGPGAHVASATFIVDPPRQGQGAGRALVLDALAWAREAGYRAMQFNAVVATNLPALALYEALGFRTVGTVPGGFEHPAAGYVDLLIMFREL
jgi:GNAT superfamily N-acetyltransferase